jgi:hypothetical protein
LAIGDERLRGEPPLRTSQRCRPSETAPLRSRLGNAFARNRFLMVAARKRICLKPLLTIAALHLECAIRWELNASRRGPAFSSHRGAGGVVVHFWD